ncbi:MAG: sulfotransferase [Thermodesulfovibrionales bacterium]
MKAEIDGRTANLPDFLVVGANKGGTTSLYYYLKQHPGIFMPVKEPNFFAFGGERPPEGTHPKAKDQAAIVWRFEDYVRLFDKAAEGQVLGEVSTPYLTGHHQVIPNIKRFVPGWEELKIIMVLREPAARAFSQYSMYRLWGVERLEFEEAVMEHTDFTGKTSEVSRYVGPGYYYEQVKAYMDNFTHVKVCLFDDLEADCPGLVRDIFRFLGVDDSFVPQMGTRYNPSGAPWSRLFHRFLSTPSVLSSRVPFLKLVPLEKRAAMTDKLIMLNIRKRVEMKEETRRRLRDLYREDVLRLQDLIGRDLSAWLK